MIAEVLERQYVAAHGKIAELSDESFIQFLILTARRHGFDHIAFRTTDPIQSQESPDTFQQFVEAYRLCQDDIETIERHLALRSGCGTRRQSNHR